MATALVIGGSGQIGRAAVPALVADGWDVRVLTRGSRAVDAVQAAGAVAVAGDRHDADALARALRGGVDVVVDVVAYDDRDADALLARAAEIGSAVVVSSAAVYLDDRGDGFESETFGTFPVPIGEDQPTVGPGRDSYATGKVALERAWAASSVPTTILRPGAIHGPGCVQPREWVFVKRALDGRDVRVLAYDGESRFHTTATAVLGELVRLAAASPAHRVLNAVDPEAPTVAEIATLVDGVMGTTSRIVRLPGAPREGVGSTPWAVPTPLVLDMARAHEQLGYVAPGGYGDTVAAAVEWLVDVAGDADWREVLPGFARMEGDGDFFDYAAEDALLAKGS
ncbi:NAD(P)-dependent oxidoreductase [Cellulomonas sp. PhB150]|uniref:NAD-dependent epimerase/dehydratase family protein n=1 Tax=Cellulomonas sp. PhB150 TaxID=2485188 RepID=UPI000F4A072D|nr:NAD(P)-dependent oxidoreductase [Cellulomonas sp. PhB150]ROS30457.1 nucleoside-diphosphate-sugar epimerase [Cellulomonas sp. PhB150]